MINMFCKINRLKILKNCDGRLRYLIVSGKCGYGRFGNCGEFGVWKVIIRIMLWGFCINFYDEVEVVVVVWKW